MPSACAQCGATLPEGTRFCGQCGATAADVANAANASSGAAVPPPPGSAPSLAGEAGLGGAVPKGTMLGAAVSPEAIAAARAAAAAVPPAPASAPAASPAGPPVPKGTMLGAAVSPELIAAARAAAEAQAAAAAAAPVPVPAAAPSAPAMGAPPPGRIAASKTMLGVAATPLEAPASPPQAPTGPGRIPVGGTMLGVAMPGIAPLAPGAAAAVLDAPGRVPAGGTMLGVATPGIAPIAPGAMAPPGYPGGGYPGAGHPGAGAVAPVGRIKVGHTAIGAVLPAPAPFVDDVAMPAAPARREKSGVPIAVVVGIVAGLVLVGGLLILLLRPGAPPITGQPHLDAQGNVLLHLQCENCADGTVVALDTGKATFKAKEAELPLTKPLEVGENNLVLKLDRPGTGRDEEVKLPVPLGFYVRADLADIAAKTPTITVRVAAAPGSTVSVDGKPLALDAAGKGAYALDVTSDTEGATEDVRIIDKKIPYVVTLVSSGGSLKGAPAQSGTVNARIAVVPLRIDEPSAHAVTEAGSFTIAGQTAAGSTVTLDGQPVAAQPDGSFAETHAATPGDTAIEIRATAPGRAPRTAHLTVKKVPSLAAEAKAVEQTPLATYDEIAPDVASKAGQRAVLAGEVLESRVTGHQTVALLSDTRGCKSGPCLARVIAAEDAKLPRGAGVRVYGTVTRAVTTSTGKTIPELAADFVVPNKR